MGLSGVTYWRLIQTPIFTPCRKQAAQAKPVLNLDSDLVVICLLAPTEPAADTTLSLSSLVFHSLVELVNGLAGLLTILLCFVFSLIEAALSVGADVGDLVLVSSNHCRCELSTYSFVELAASSLSKLLALLLSLLSLGRGVARHFGLSFPCIRYVMSACPTV